MAGELMSREYIFVLLTAIVKKYGGEIKITEAELISVTKSDIIKLLYDRNNKEFILSLGLFSQTDDTIN